MMTGMPCSVGPLSPGMGWGDRRLRRFSRGWSLFAVLVPPAASARPASMSTSHPRYSSITVGTEFLVWRGGSHEPCPACSVPPLLVVSAARHHRVWISSWLCVAAACPGLWPAGNLESGRRIAVTRFEQVASQADSWAGGRRLICSSTARPQVMLGSGHTAPARLTRRPDARCLGYSTQSALSRNVTVVL